MSDSAPSYSAARSDLISSARSIRIFGIVLNQERSNGEFIVMWYCGWSGRGYEHRECTKRLFHLLASDVDRSGEVDGFTCDGHQVSWFEVSLDTGIVEEEYTSLSVYQLVPVLTDVPTPAAAPIPTITTPTTPTVTTPTTPTVVTPTVGAAIPTTATVSTPTTATVPTPTTATVPIPTTATIEPGPGPKQYPAD